MANLQIPNLEGADAKLAELTFEFVQFLLDDDLNLTPAGNLTGGARQKLRDRLGELIAAEESSDEGPGTRDEEIAHASPLAPAPSPQEAP